MAIARENFILRDHCYVNRDSDHDRFVGIKADSQNVMIYFPIGYELPTNDDELRRDIKNLILVLSTFTEKKDRLLEVDDRITISQSADFPIQAYLYIINHFINHNGSYYTETETTYKIDKRGKTDWGKTIKTQTPLIQGKSIIYLDRVVRVSTPDLNRLITQIHKYCVYESFKRMGWLYTSSVPEKPDITFDRNMFITTLISKLGNTNNNEDKTLFRSMIDMIKFIDNQKATKQFYFGTNTFETVWEKLIDKVFGIPNKDYYFPHAKWTERYGESKGKTASALEPDTIMIYKDKYYVLDAKYYRYGISPKNGPRLLPQSSDINKQITYGQFVKNQRTPAGAKVFNAFLMPYNKAKNDFKINSLFGNVAEATGDWIDNPTSPKTYERIQGIVLDTRYLLKNYIGNHDADKAQLAHTIEFPFPTTEKH